MAFMSCLQKQNTNKVTGRYGTAKLPSLLPEMQTGNSNQCETTEYHSYQRARRTDAEPIICSLKYCCYRLFFDFNLCP